MLQTYIRRRNNMINESWSYGTPNCGACLQGVKTSYRRMCSGPSHITSSPAISTHPPTYLPTHLLTYLWLCSPLLGLGHFFTFLIFSTVGRTDWTGDQPVARPLPAYSTAHKTQNKHKETSMPQVGFELTIVVFERSLDRAASYEYSKRKQHTGTRIPYLRLC
jgi:hypothetical protein